jgi:hypothetical protein
MDAEVRGEGLNLVVIVFSYCPPLLHSEGYDA